jgi:hypothetical protein
VAFGERNGTLVVRRHRVRKFVFFVGFTGVAMVIAAGAACSNSTPSDGRIDLPARSDAEVDSAAAESCTNLSLRVGEPDSCDKCAKDKCCTEVLACTRSADCTALQECLTPCAQDDIVCILGCQETHPKGNDALTEVGSCARAKCKNECPSNAADADIFGDGGL